MADDAVKQPLPNVAQRVITAAVVGPLVVIAVLAGGLPFTLVVTGFAIVGILEFYNLAHDRPFQGSAVIGVPTLILIILAFHFGLPALSIVVLALSVVVTSTLETVRHPTDIRRNLIQVGLTLAGVLYLAFP